MRDPHCTRCPLHADAETVCLWGHGPKRPRVVVVGEAPGALEDEMGVPFVGPSGKLLDKALNTLAGIDRSEVYVTNVVKCRPPENRTPKAPEIKTCTTEFLWPEVKALEPEWVLTLGNVPLKVMTGKSGITNHHGNTFRRGGLTIFSTLHPAAVLRNPHWAQAFAMDLKRFGEMVAGTYVSSRTRVFLARTTEDIRILRRYLMAADEISWDIETYTFPAQAPYVRTNFQEWHGDQSCIVSISFSWVEGVSVVVPLWHERSPFHQPQLILDYLRPAMERTDCHYIGHNGKFDARWGRAKGIRVPQTWDTMLSCHMLDENKPKGLKQRSRSELGVDAYDVGEELKDAFHMDLHQLCIYNGKDTDYTLRLKHRDEDAMADQDRIRRVYEKLMMPASDVLVDVERTGIYIDPDRWEERYETAVNNRDKIDAYIQRKYVPEDMRPLNFRSPQQIGRLLFDHMGLPVTKRTKAGGRSTDESVLLRMAEEYPVATAIIKYRKWAKYVNTYLGPLWFEHRDPATGRIHSTYKPSGTVTGRLSGTGGVHQIPRDAFIRAVLGAEPGWTFLQADYSQVELRIAAMLANEPTMLRAYELGQDIHMNTAVSITGKMVEDIEKEERKRAKGVNFGFIYGMSWRKFVDYAFDSYGVVVTDDEAERYRERFFETYPRLRPWHEKQRRLARKYQRVVSPIGRVRHLTNIMSSDKEVRAEAERQAINSPVQSLASDIMLLSLIELHGQMATDSGARIIGTVHDSILFEIEDHMVDHWAPIIKRTMEDVSRVERMFGCEITVPIVADIETGTHWGETTEWEAA